MENKFINENLILDNCGRISWKNSIGKIFSVVYEDVKYTFIITKYNSKNRKINFKYYQSVDDTDYSMITSNILKASIGIVIGKYSFDYKYKINDIVNDNKIIKYSKINYGGKYVKSYYVECIHDGYKRDVSENSLNNGCTCPVCTNKIVVRGINDLWTTHPDIAKLLKNPEDGYKYSSGSGKKLLWICPYCKNVIRSRIPDVIYNNGKLRCNRCSDGFSYPEKLMSNILYSLNIDYKFHVKIEDGSFIFRNKDYNPEYDFLINYNNRKIIIEMDGNFHNRPHQHSDITIEETQYIDSQKDRLAIENGYEIIRVDCRISNYEYIINSIKNTELNNIIDVQKLNKIELDTISCRSRLLESCELYNAGYKITEIAEKYKIHTATIREYLKRGTELKLCTYIPYKDSQGNGSKKVICLNTREVYESIRSASIDKNIDEIHISECCRHKTMTCSSKDKKYNNLIWLYYDEYQELINNFVSIEDYISECLRIKYSKKNTKVICLETKKVFNSMADAYRWMGYNIDGRTIKDNCIGKLKSAGKHPVTKEKLHWMFYDNYANDIEKETDVVL